MLWKRLLKDKEGKAWRRIYKSLLLLQYLIRNGSERVVESARDHVYDVRQLERFEYIDDKGKDQGINGWAPTPKPQTRTHTKKKKKEKMEEGKS